MAEPELDPIFAALEPQLGAPVSEPRPLSGGITNRNFVVAFPGGEFVLRVCSPGVEVISIDRETEVAANRSAHAAGVAPAVAAWLPDQHLGQ